MIVPEKTMNAHLSRLKASTKLSTLEKKIPEFLKVRSQVIENYKIIKKYFHEYYLLTLK